MKILTGVLTALILVTAGIGARADVIVNPVPGGDHPNILHGNSFAQLPEGVELTHCGIWDARTNSAGVRPPRCVMHCPGGYEGELTSEEVPLPGKTRVCDAAHGYRCQTVGTQGNYRHQAQQQQTAGGVWRECTRRR